MLSEFLIKTWEMIVLSAPWLLFGFFLAGVIHIFFPLKVIERHLKKPGLGSVLKASAVGVPLPLCSCSVIPIGVSLRRSGASRGATAAFFVSTPEIGVDSFVLSYFLLGPFLAMARVVAAFFSAITVGLAVDKWGTKDEIISSPIANQENSCCHDENTNDPTPISFGKKIKEVFHYGFIEIVDDLSPSLAVGLLISGGVSAFFPPDLFSKLELSEFGLMLAALVISLPTYVCATSSTPLAAALLSKGLNPGAVLVFLLAGPASNVATMLVIKKEFGGKGLLSYVLGISGISLIIGYLTNLFYAQMGNPNFSLPAGFEHEHLHEGAVYGGMVVVLLLIWSLWRRTRVNSQTSACH